MCRRPRSARSWPPILVWPRPGTRSATRLAAAAVGTAWPRKWPIPICPPIITRPIRRSWPSWSNVWLKRTSIPARLWCSSTLLKAPASRLFCQVADDADVDRYVALVRGQAAETGDDDDELATRLAYFLTSEPPDDRLAEQAVTGRIGNLAVLARETRRLAGETFVPDFMHQWLGLASLDSLMPDARLIDNFNFTPAIRATVKTEVIHDRPQTEPSRKNDRRGNRRRSGGKRLPADGPAGRAGAKRRVSLRVRVGGVSLRKGFRPPCRRGFRVLAN